MGEMFTLDESWGDVRKKLNSLQSQFGVVAAFGGDSRIDAGYSRGGTYDRLMTHGFPMWVQSLSRGRVRCPVTLNFGVNGDSTAGMVTRLPAIIASCLAAGVRLFFLLVSTNDRNNTTLTGLQSIANIQTIVDALRAVGIIVIIVAELPRGSGSVLSGVNLKRHMYVHAKLQLFSEQPGVYVVDVWPTICDETDASGQPLSGNFYDGLHPNIVGAYNVSVAIVALVNQLIPAPPILPVSNADLYDATDNVTGALNSNPMMAGTGGTGKANVATGYFCGDQNADYTITCSKVTSNGKAWQQMAISGTPVSSSPSAYLSQAVNSNFTPGDILEGVCEYEMDANTASLPPSLYVFSNGGAAPMTGGDGVSSTAAVGQGPATAYAGILRTPRIVVGSGATSLGLQFAIPGRQSVAQVTTARVRAMKLQKVA